MRESWWSAALLLMVCTLGFGWQIGKLGFYWDDYASVVVYESHGADVFADWSTGQGRPVAGYLLSFMWDEVGLNPLVWHGLDFALYVASVLLFWAILRRLWPDYRTQATLTALLFAVYPSYQLRPIPISLVIVLSLTLCLLSFWLMILAVQRRSILLLLLATLLIPVYQLIYEQNLAFEALRPLILMTLFGTWQPRAWMRYWLPLGVVAALLVIYRFVLFEPNSTYATYNDPFNLKTIDGWLLIARQSLNAPIKMLFFDWVHVPWRLFGEAKIDSDLPGFIATFFLVACLGYLWKFSDDKLPRYRETLGLVAVAVGVIALLLFFVHAVGQVLGDGFNSRWALSPSLLAALILGWGIPRLLRSAVIGHLVLVALILLGLAAQVAVNEYYADDWELRRELGWQMRWRAPSVAPGTTFTLVTSPDTFAFDRQLNDYELTGHFNLYYPLEDYPAMAGGEPRIIRLIYTADLPQQGQWSQVISGSNVIFRDWPFDLDRLVVFGYDGGCLVTAQPDQRVQAIDNSLFEGFAPLHHPSQFQAQSINTEALPSVIGSESEHRWCFYYQRVQWALQYASPEEAAALVDEARTQGFAPTPGHEEEWLPMIEAYLQVGRSQDAEPMIYAMLLADEHSRAVICQGDMTLVGLCQSHP
jgi:hypothetical protein